jgi:transcriptional regulator with XRE-family HTH domain
VRALRLASDMTQEDLAAHCGLFRTYMSRIETGQANPTLTMIHALAVALSVKPAVLLSDDALPNSGELTAPEAQPAPSSATRRNRKLGNPPSRGRVT